MMYYYLINGTLAIVFLFERRGGILPWSVVFLAPPFFSISFVPQHIENLNLLIEVHFPVLQHL